MNRQSQKQTTQQKLGLTQIMQTSLSLLSMGQDDIRDAIQVESRRNPFLSAALPKSGAGVPNYQEDAVAYQDIVDDPRSIDSVISQISTMRLSDGDRILATQLAHCLDERGLFTEDPEEISQYLNTDPQRLTALVEQLQIAVEPAGVFAWSLQDCFYLQLKAMNRYDPMIAILLDHLDLIAHQDIVQICKVTKADTEDVEDMLADIRKLSPAPLSPPIEYIEVQQSADIFLRENKDGKIELELNAAAFPDLLTNDALFSTVKSTETDSSSLAYYRDCYRQAAAFVIAMQKRANTLLKLGREIARVQTSFIRSNRQLDRKPLTMGQLADDLGLNKSTVSRALNNCLFDTPHGPKPAKEFFARPLTHHAKGKTREQALARLALLIKTEDRKRPHPDEILAEMMSMTNFHISRRTVAKYRGQLGIPNAFVRRSEKGF